MLQTNPYLNDAKKGIKLIEKILQPADINEDTVSLKIKSILDKRLMPLLAEAQIEGEFEIATELRRISAKLKTADNLDITATKVIVGIGGMFSSGKSCFINSLMGHELLPEGQEPTTSIATYICNDDKRSNVITNMFGANVVLDNDAVSALKHQFYQIYQVGFSAYANNLIIKTPQFKYNSIAILDTPGYNKSDSQKKQTATDNEKARLQLQAADYIIWLVDIENGGVKDADLEFLEATAPNIPILFVINKADKKPESYVAEIIEGIRCTLSDSFLQWVDVVAYSSALGKEVLSESIIADFLQRVEQEASNKEDIYAELLAICDELKEQLSRQEKTETSIADSMVMDINCTSDLFNMNYIIEQLKSTRTSAYFIKVMLKSLKNIINDFNNLLQRSL